MNFILFPAYLYFFFQILLVVGLFRHKKINRSKTQPFISVVIAAHNEAGKIEPCLDSLLNQSYPRDQYEIIVIDDRSQDETQAIAKNVLKNFPEYQIIPILKTPPGYSPKKYALQQGIKATRGEWILTTDADCIAPPEWILEMVQFCGIDTGMISGNVDLTGNRLLQKIISLDHSFFTYSYAGTMGLDFPTYCSGGNRGFSMNVYQEVQGFQTIATVISGDDDLFMHLIRQKTNKTIRFVLSTAATICTEAPRSLMDFVKQRTRHTSKTTYYPRKMIVGLLFLFLFNLMVLYGFFNLSVTGNGIWLSFLTLKLLADFVLMASGMLVLNEWRKILVFPLWWFLHPFYVVGFGIWGQIGNIKWKGQEFKKSL